MKTNEGLLGYPKYLLAPVLEKKNKNKINTGKEVRSLTHAYDAVNLNYDLAQKMQFVYQNFRGLPERINLDPYINT